MNFERGCPSFDGAMSNAEMQNNNEMWMGKIEQGNCNPEMVGSMPVMPVYECPEEKVCHRYICYDVPHIKPCNTKIINHHVYRHTFTPCYTCCEENVVENVFGCPRY